MGMRRGSKSVFGGTMGNGVLMKLVYLLLELLATRWAIPPKMAGVKCLFFCSQKNAVGTLDAGQDLRMVWQCPIDYLEMT